MSRKHQVYQYCEQRLVEQIQQAKKAMEEAQQFANMETKSSAGDKYETGRAMSQLDKERHAQRLVMATNTLQALQEISPSLTCDTVRKGALVTTDIGIFFIAIGLGTVTINEHKYTIISSESPIGQAMLDLEQEDEFVFRSKQITILSVE